MRRLPYTSLLENQQLRAFTFRIDHRLSSLRVVLGTSRKIFGPLEL
jgi:hypothetical protein